MDKYDAALFIWSDMKSMNNNEDIEHPIRSLQNYNIHQYYDLGEPMNTYMGLLYELQDMQQKKIDNSFIIEMKYNCSYVLEVLNPLDIIIKSENVYILSRDKTLYKNTKHSEKFINLIQNRKNDFPLRFVLSGEFMAIKKCVKK